MPSDLRQLLKRYFGFDSFRPLQEEIMRDVMAGKDVFALLPTGGGKSLCFQLPALAREGLTLVISPLIALMKDQVDALQASGIAATFLNSSLEAGEARDRLRGLHRGEYKLLYVAPERVMLSGFLSDLTRWKVNFIAIDEAHCISEWGHDFRPEYRRLPELRAMLPNLPMLALTATATTRVREDIVQLLKLHQPKVYVASFNRPNLQYRITSKTEAYDQVLPFIKQRRHESGIIYCSSRNGAESLADRLNRDGVKASSYHAGLSGEQRSRNQEAFIRDNVQVICATIAFGMGINKPDVRFVIHYDLPKNVEGYYQETGRAGRDGLPSECWLLFSRGDAVKQARFIADKPTEQEKLIARQQLDEMLSYAETPECRRSFLLRYFGETFGEPNCGSCDNCLTPRDSFEATIPAQKLLSCVYRIHQQSGFGVGLRHVIEVLVGANTEKIRKWNHQSLSTYGIGKDLDKDKWGHIGRELVRLGYISQRPENFHVAEVTKEGLDFLKQRKQLLLLKAYSASEEKSTVAHDAPFDIELFEELRILRKRIADERVIPAYVIFSDVTLRDIARVYPTNEREFALVGGVGEKKLRELAPEFIRAVTDFLKTNPKQAFAVTPAKGQRTKIKSLNDSASETLSLFNSKKSPAQIAAIRGLAEATICGHLEQAILNGHRLDTRRFFTPEQERQMKEAFAKHGPEFGNVYRGLGESIPFHIIRIFRALEQP